MQGWSKSGNLKTIKRFLITITLLLLPMVLDTALTSRLSSKKERHLSALHSLFGSIFGANTVWAADKAELTADHLIYDYDHKQLVAKGNALLQYKDLKLSGEELRIDTEHNILKAEGLVEIDKDGDLITGYGFYYYLDEETGEITDYSWIETSETGEPMILRGEVMEIDGETLIGKESEFTSCDRDNPHFHLTASKVEYFPGDRIVFYKVKYYEGRYQLFSIPKWVVSLKEERNNFDETVFGYNQYDGWYLKAVYRYYMESGHNGKILLDLIEKRGIGEGVLNNFPMGEGKELSASIYHFGYQTGADDYQFGAGWTHRINEQYNYSLKGDYWRTVGILLPLQERYLITATATGRDPVWPFSLNMTTGVSGAQYYLRPKLNLTWRPSSQTKLEYRGELDYKRRLSDSLVDEKYRYDLEFLHNWQVDKGEYFKLNLKLHEAQDLSPVPNPYWRDWNQLPYLAVDTPWFNLDFLGVYQVKLDYLRLVEVPSLVEGERMGFLCQRRDEPIWRAGRFRLNLIGNLRTQKYWVEEGSFARKALTVGFAGVHSFTSNLSLRNTLSWVESEGQAPRSFSRLVSDNTYYLPNANLRSGLYYQSRDANGRIESGYHLSAKIDPWYPVIIVFDWIVNPENRLNFSTSYNPNTDKWREIRLVARYEPNKENQLLVDMIYDPEENVWSTLDVEAKLRYYIISKLQSDINLKYSFFQDKLEKAKLGIVYDWHCREVYLGYDFTREEYALQVQYKVFPEAGFGFGSSDTGFSFGL